MRDILFRGKTISTDKWVYGGYAKMDDRHFIIVNQKYNDNTCSWGAYDVHPETVGEYTGLNDKDNNKIFEDDILLFCDDPVLVYWNPETLSWMAKKAVEYPTHDFPDRNWNRVSLGWVDAEVACLGYMTTQVGGNIHDNPESFIIERKEDNWEEF